MIYISYCLVEVMGIFIFKLKCNRLSWEGMFSISQFKACFIQYQIFWEKMKENLMGVQARSIRKMLWGIMEKQDENKSYWKRGVLVESFQTERKKPWGQGNSIYQILALYLIEGSHSEDGTFNYLILELVFEQKVNAEGISSPLTEVIFLSGHHNSKLMENGL